MQRYFFDLAARSHVHYDYRGREFSKAEHARDLAELIALDIEYTNGDGFDGAEVQVRSVSGQHLFSVAIRAPELIAA